MRRSSSFLLSVGKKVINSILVISLLLSLLPCEVHAALFSKVDVTDEELFLRYPQYIAYNSNSMDFIEDAFGLCFKIVSSQGGKKSAMLATILDDGVTIGAQEFASKFGWGKDYQASLLESATEKFLCAISAGDGTMPSVLAKKADLYVKPFSTLKDFTKALPEDETITIVSNMLSSLGIASSNSKAKLLYKVVAKGAPVRCV